MDLQLIKCEQCGPLCIFSTSFRLQWHVWCVWIWSIPAHICLPWGQVHVYNTRTEAQVTLQVEERRSNFRQAKWRGTKKPLDESKRGEWKSWLKAQHSENEEHGIWSHHSMGNRWGNSGDSVRLFFGAPKSLQMVIASMKLKDAYSLEEKLWAT